MKHGAKDGGGSESAKMIDLPFKLQQLFDRYAVELVVFSDLASVGSREEEKLDGFQGSQIATPRLSLKMYATSRILSERVDPGQLREMLDGIDSALQTSHADDTEG